MFLDGALTSDLQLPMEWLNDMVDEFLYQFQDFCQYRMKLKNKSQEDLAMLQAKGSASVWKASCSDGGTQPRSRKQAPLRPRAPTRRARSTPRSGSARAARRRCGSCNDPRMPARSGP